ncbi:RNA binding (RRM/RBD/RNP motifs) family protein [Euphorbia peplus]|nr:RNA binding (RRM/RBD/RNP motifs) family protein [Euphorbia peplus]
MGSVVDRVEDRTFKVNFTGDGAAKLRAKVNDKLKEFMGDYTDDTLVEYVIVLLRNGRRMEEARNELNVFLGDDSDSFVAWLWDHLGSNLDLYVQSQDSIGVIKTTVGDSGNEYHHVEAESGKGKSENLSRSRNKREWKGLMRDATEPPPLRSSVVDTVHIEERGHLKASSGRSSSPDPPKQKKRNRQDERQHLKREDVSQATINAPRRLLQFAVRDAVGTTRPSTLSREPSMKRLRSVVSTSAADSSLFDHPRRLQSIARVPNPMATVIKAVQEAAEDVKLKSARSVFDRLGRDIEMSDTAAEISEIGGAIVENEQYEEFDHSPGRIDSIYLQEHDYADDGLNIGTTESEIRLVGDLVPDYELYVDNHVMGHRVVDVSETSTSGGNRRPDFMLQYNLGNSDAMHIPRNRDHIERASATKTSGSISINSSIWRPPHYQESREALEIDNRKSVLENEPDAGKSGIRLMKENGNPVLVGNGNANPVADVLKESLKTPQTFPGTYTTGRPLEDADSRTIFVSNVHFAATKDSLSRHFNKFGEVLKVVILTDAATGQPKGSAYVEFMRKEAADNALSLDGTSFMSRILKVVKRSAAHQEVSAMTWPRVSRGSSYATGRFNRVPFPRGMPGAFRSRLPMKPGARSFQWKRDAQTATPEGGAPVSGSLVAPTARSLTYVRTESKPDGGSSATT